MKYIATKETGIFDLYVVFGGGTRTMVKLNKGDILPTDCLEPKDVEKSLKFGGLSRLLKNGTLISVDDKDADKKIKEILGHHKPLPSEIETKQVSSGSPKKPYNNVEIASQKATEAKREEGMTEIIKINSKGDSLPVDMVQFEQATGTDKSGGTVAIGVELQPTDPRNPNGDKGIDGYESKTDFSEIHTYTAFEGLNHPDQVLFCKQCSNKTLLTEIMTNSSKKQIINNGRKRLEELK